LRRVGWVRGCLSDSARRMTMAGTVHGCRLGRGFEQLCRIDDAR
jgi:hypothetical protein